MNKMSPSGYDYIIIGGGSAGSVVAARLTEDAACRVLLLEAGGRDTHPLFHMPAGFAKMTSGLAAWGYETVPQVHMRKRVFRYTQAKVLGGGSTINAQIYIRGNRLDYDEWRQQGCTGWGYDDVLPFFQRAEDNQRFSNEFHAQGGPLSVQDPRAPLPICDAFFAAAEERGIPRNPDFNGERQDGTGFYQLTQRNGRRCSVVTAYLKPARKRPNLTIRTDVFVTRLRIEKGRVTGVELAGPTGVERITADREVVLSASTIGSPKLLMLSGIGPASHLSASGVKPLADLPGVGGNLQDHLDFFVIAECTGHTHVLLGEIQGGEAGIISVECGQQPRLSHPPEHVQGKRRTHVRVDADVGIGTLHQPEDLQESVEIVVRVQIIGEGRRQRYTVGVRQVHHCCWTHSSFDMAVQFHFG